MTGGIGMGGKTLDIYERGQIQIGFFAKSRYHEYNFRKARYSKILLAVVCRLGILFSISIHVQLFVYRKRAGN